MADHGVIFKGENYVFMCVCFRISQAHQLPRCLEKIAHYGNQTHPNVAKTILLKRYMDNILELSSSKDVLDITQREIDDLVRKFGFNIKEWVSNHPCVGNTVETK